MDNLIPFLKGPFIYIYILNIQCYITDISFIRYLLDINLQVPDENFSEQPALEPGLLFLT